MSKDTAFGMMDGTYFVGRNEILAWINDILKLDYTKIEQTASGAAHCQIMDILYPGVPLSKVKFNALHEYEFVNNFKILQNVFDKQGIDKMIDVSKLVKAKYQDNLEFCQWMKRFFDLHNGGQEYNAPERRKYAYNGDKKFQGQGSSSPAPSTTAAAPAKAVPKKTEPAKKATTAAPKPAPKATTAAAKTSTPKAVAKNDSSEELGTQITELKLAVEGLEKERDFYFGKLREVEVLCQNSDQSLDVVQSILKILYATDETEGFVAEESEPQQEEAQEQVEEEIESF